MAKGYKINSQEMDDVWGVYVEKVEGVLDLSARKGKTEHNWLDENGVEEYTEAADIRLEARDITLRCFISATSQTNFHTQLNAFKAELIQSGLQTLELPYFTSAFSVYYQKKMRFTTNPRWNDSTLAAKFVLTLREPDPTVPS